MWGEETQMTKFVVNKKDNRAQADFLFTKRQQAWNNIGHLFSW